MKVIIGLMVVGLMSGCATQEPQGVSSDTPAKRNPREADIAGLDWLARHQSPDGHWDASGFSDQCDASRGEKCTGPGNPVYNEAVSALAVDSLVADDNYLMDERFRDAMTKGLKWLLSRQHPDGYIGNDGASRSVYNHAISTMVLCDAYIYLDPERDFLHAPIQKALDYLVSIQNPDHGWGNTVGDPTSNTLMTGWCFLPLWWAKESHPRFTVPDAVFQGILSWLDSVTGKDGVVGYDRTHQYADWQEDVVGHDHETCTAIGINIRIKMKVDRDDPGIKEGVARIQDDLPIWKQDEIDYQYWFFAIQGMWEFFLTNMYDSSPTFSKWNHHKHMLLTDHSNKDDSSCNHGSWDPVDRWGRRGGRVYATAINLITLSIHQRSTNPFRKSKRTR